MSAGFDFFVGFLKCPVCGRVSAADSSTNMQTYIRDEPELANLGVGQHIDIDPAAMQEKHYWAIQPIVSDKPIKLLEVWDCPFCGHPANWAEITILDGTIVSVEAVPLNRTIFEDAHFISDECISEASDLTGKPIPELFGADLVQILREEL